MNKEKLYGEELKREIFEQATHLFYERGFGNTSIQDIMDAVGVTKGSFYYYFKDKETLLFKIHEISLGKLLALVRMAANNESLSPEEKLKEVILMSIKQLCNRNGSPEYFTYVQEIRHLTPEHEKMSRTWRREYLDLFIGIIKSGIEQGQFKENLDPKIVAYALIGMCMWTTSWLNPDGNKSIEEVTQMFFELFITGVRK